MICRYNYLYAFLLTVPFFNIIVLHFRPEIIQVYIIFFVCLGCLIFKPLPVRKSWSAPIFIIFGLILSLMFSETLSRLNFGQSNFDSIRFFGLFIPILLFYVGFMNPNYFWENYLVKLLRYYIYVFAGSIFVDYFILYFLEDISLQLMYSKDDLSYHGRPFGITGQPSVNSVLLVVFYTFLISKVSRKYIIFLFFLVTTGVFLQGSGSGFIALGMLLLALILRLNWVYQFILYPCFLTFLVFLFNKYDILDRISIDYLSAMVSVFYDQTSSWISVVVYSDISPAISLLFGGFSSGIDFGPLFIVSNVGLLFFILYLVIIIWCAVKARDPFEKWAIFILCVGNVHYPVMFYLVMAFFFPLILQRYIFPVKLSCSLSRNGMF